MGAVFTQERSGPPFDLDERISPFSAFLEDGAGSNQMAVVATPAAPQVFSVPASPDTDLYIVTLQIIITALDMDFGDFGNGLALTNPCVLAYKTETQSVVLSDTLSSNSEFVLLAQGQPAFGTTTPPTAFNSFKAQNPVGGNETEDAYIPSLDFRKVFGLPWGIKLPHGRDTALSMTITDDTTNASSFTARVFGFARFPDAGSLVTT